MQCDPPPERLWTNHEQLSGASPDRQQQQVGAHHGCDASSGMSTAATPTTMTTVPPSIMLVIFS
jgi:hypothetical protein